MAEFIDIIAQLKFDVQGDGTLKQVGVNLDKANTEADALTAQVNGLKTAIKQTDSQAQKGVLQKELKKASNEAKQLQANVKNTGGAFGKLGSLAAGAFAGFSILELGQQIISATSQFQKFEAVLTNLTGSNEEAKQLINTFSQFAAETPFQVEEVVGAYVKLRNTGIIPNVEELRKLGDVASASGKDLNQLVEALIDAQVGENERLKEFGIRAQRQGEITKFTFRGVTTEVQNTSEAISAYIFSLGELEGVQGSNAAIAQTLGGQISNLKDSFTQFAKELGQAVAPELRTVLGLFSDILNGFRKIISLRNEAKEATDIVGGIPFTFFEREQFTFVRQFLPEIEKAIDFGGKGTLARLKFLQGKINKAFEDGLINQDVLFRLSAKLQEAGVLAEQEIAKTIGKTTTKAITDPKAAEARKKAIQDITADLQSALADQEQKLRETQIKAKEESIETIRALSELEKQEALRAIDEREAAIKEKLKGKVPADIQALLAQLRTGIDRQFALTLEQDIDAFKAKKEKEIIEFETARAAARAATRAKAAEEAAKDLEDFINSLGNINKTYSLQSEIAEADALTAITNQYKRGAISKEEFEKQKTDIQRKYQSERIRLAIEEIEQQIDALKQLNDPAKLGQVQELQAQIAKLRQDGAELQAEPVEKNKELFNTIKAGYSEVLSIVQQVNAAIVANETEKVNKLIALQQQRVDEANRIADEGNAEALEREQARLETLLVQREEAAQRQQRLSLILQASNFALAASEAILLITKEGVKSPFLIPVAGAALAAGIGFILSLLNGAKGSVAAFKEGTPYVTGSDGIDKVPAMLTKGERVITVDDNQRYSPIYDYLSTHRPTPSVALAMLKGNAPNYAGLQTAYETNRRIEAERALSKALLEKLTFVNGNLEILVTETVKNRNTGKVKITNVNDIAKAVNSDNLRWKI